nr:phospholemman isoform X6 [Caretta caretta]
MDTLTRGHQPTDRTTPALQGAASPHPTQIPLWGGSYEILPELTPPAPFLQTHPHPLPRPLPHSLSPTPPPPLSGPGAPRCPVPHSAFGRADSCEGSGSLPRSTTPLTTTISP